MCRVLLLLTCRFSLDGSTFLTSAAVVPRQLPLRSLSSEVFSPLSIQEEGGNERAQQLLGLDGNTSSRRRFCITFKIQSATTTFIFFQMEITMIRRCRLELSDERVVIICAVAWCQSSSSLFTGCLVKKPRKNRKSNFFLFYWHGDERRAPPFFLWSLLLAHSSSRQKSFHPLVTAFTQTNTHAAPLYTVAAQDLWHSSSQKPSQRYIA